MFQKSTTGVNMVLILAGYVAKALLLLIFYIGGTGLNANPKLNIKIFSYIRNFLGKTTGLLNIIIIRSSLYT